MGSSQTDYGKMGLVPNCKKRFSKKIESQVPQDFIETGRSELELMLVGPTSVAQVRSPVAKEVCWRQT